jgi:hypothetical protein
LTETQVIHVKSLKIKADSVKGLLGRMALTVNLIRPSTYNNNCTDNIKQTIMKIVYQYQHYFAIYLKVYNIRIYNYYC